MQPISAHQGLDPATQLPCTYYVYPPRPVAAAPMAPPIVTQYNRSEPTPVYTPQPIVKKTRVVRERHADPCGDVVCGGAEPTGVRCGDDCANMECSPARIWCNLLNPFALCAALCPRPRTRDGKNPMDVPCSFRDVCPCCADFMDWACCYNCEPRRVRRVRVEEPRAMMMVEAPEVHTVCVECGECLDVQTTACTGSHCPAYGKPYGSYETIRGVPARHYGRTHRSDIPPIPNGDRSRHNY